MRIGILGGAFDPPHEGHVALARAAMRECGLDRLLLIPSGDPPYKKPQAGRADRLTMTRLAAREIPGAEVSEIEILREGPTYAADTLRELRKEYPDAELIYVLGADALKKTGRWKNADEVRSLCSFAAACREGEMPEGEGILRITADLPNVSSGELRKALSQGVRCADGMPKAVADYALKRGLYLTALPESEILADLRSRLNAHRFFHTLGVMRASEELARRFGADEGRARVAALLHDCAKCLPPEEITRLAVEYGADADELRCFPVLHAPAAANLAVSRYGVRDEVVLQAIRRHTIGAGRMTLQDTVLYVADMIEPGRKPFPGLERARMLAMEDLTYAALCCANLTLRFIRKGGGAMHPELERMIRQMETGGANNG